MAYRSEMEIGVNQRRIHNDVVAGVRSGAAAAEPVVVKTHFPTDGLKKFALPLGRITGDMDQFQSSLNASVARVLAFGASASVLAGVSTAMRGIVEAGIEVQQTMTEINTILGVSASGLAKFSSAMFDIARNTATSFKDTGAAALELARQGLGAEETMKRLNDALILSKLSGIDTASAVNTLTASINGFSKEGVSSTEIVNRLASVDAAFAVSTNDLAQALSRAGAVSQDAGVSFNELIAVVTSVQQQTARGGSVIGNGFKSIFTRIQRSGVREMLESIGVSTTNASGEFRGAIPILQDYARAYQTLSDSQKSATAEQLAGVYQINTLKALMKDLNSEYSIYSGALNTANGATDEASVRMEQLNQTTSALLQNTSTSIKEFGAALSSLAAEEGLRNVLTVINVVSSKMAELLDEEKGNALAKALVGGIGKFIAGPGLLMIGRTFFNLLKFLGAQTISALKQIGAINVEKLRQEKIEIAIGKALNSNDAAVEAIVKSEGNRIAQEQIILGVIKEQQIAMKNLQMMQSAVSSVAARGNVFVGAGGMVGMKPKKASGYVPNFSVNNSDAVAETMAAYQAGYTPGRPYNTRIHDGRGGSFMSTVNSAESVKTVVGPNGQKGTFVTPPNAADGFIPNFAGAWTGWRPSGGGNRNSKIGKAIVDKKISAEDAIANLGYVPSAQKIAERKSRAVEINRTIDLGFTNKLAMIIARQGGVKKIDGTYSGQDGQKYKVGFLSAGMSLPVRPESIDLEKNLGENVKRFTNSYINRISKDGGKIKSINELSNIGSFKSMVGTIFETAVTKGFQKDSSIREGGASALVDFVNPSPQLRKLFHGVKGAYEAKWNEGLANDVARKAVLGGYTSIPASRTQAGQKVRKGFALGYVPNFAETASSAVTDAVGRESAAGIPDTAIRIQKSARLRNSRNPTGLAVTNTMDEPRGLADVFGGGYVPNFAAGEIGQEGLYAALKRRAEAEKAGAEAAEINTKKKLKEGDASEKVAGNFGMLAFAAQSALYTISAALSQSKSAGAQATGAGISAGLTAGYAGQFIAGPAIGAAGTALEKFGGAVGTFGKTLGKFSPYAGAAIGVVVGLGTAIYKMTSKTEALKREMEKAQGVFAKSQEWSDKYVSKVRELNTALEEGKTDNISEIRRELEKLLLLAPSDKMGDAFLKAGDNLQTLEKIAREFLAEIEGKAKDIELRKQYGAIERGFAPPEMAGGNNKRLEEENLQNQRMAVANLVEKARRDPALLQDIIKQSRGLEEIVKKNEELKKTYEDLSLIRQKIFQTGGSFEYGEDADTFRKLSAAVVTLDNQINIATRDAKNLGDGPLARALQDPILKGTEQLFLGEAASKIGTPFMPKGGDIFSAGLPQTGKMLSSVSGVVTKITEVNKQEIELFDKVIQSSKIFSAKMTAAARYLSQYNLDKTIAEIDYQTQMLGFEEALGVGSLQKQVSAIAISGGVPSKKDIKASELNKDIRKFTSSIGLAEALKSISPEARLGSTAPDYLRSEESLIIAKIDELKKVNNEESKAQIEKLTGILNESKRIKEEAAKATLIFKLSQMQAERAEKQKTAAEYSKSPIFKSIEELKKTMSSMSEAKTGREKLSAIGERVEMATKFGGTDTIFGDLAKRAIGQQNLLQNVEDMASIFAKDLLSGVTKKEEHQNRMTRITEAEGRKSHYTYETRDINAGDQMMDLLRRQGLYAKTTPVYSKVVSTMGYTDEEGGGKFTSKENYRQGIRATTYEEKVSSMMSRVNSILELSEDKVKASAGRVVGGNYGEQDIKTLSSWQAFMSQFEAAQSELDTTRRVGQIWGRTKQLREEGEGGKKMNWSEAWRRASKEGANITSVEDILRASKGTKEGADFQSRLVKAGLGEGEGEKFRLNQRKIASLGGNEMKELLKGYSSNETENILNGIKDNTGTLVDLLREYLTGEKTPKEEATQIPIAGPATQPSMTVNMGVVKGEDSNGIISKAIAVMDKELRAALDSQTGMKPERVPLKRATPVPLARPTYTPLARPTYTPLARPTY